MKIKQTDIVTLYPALNVLSTYSMPIQTAWKVYQALSKTKELFQFGMQEEKKTVEKYGGKLKQDGKYGFDNYTDAENYRKEITNLFNFETELDVDPFEIKLSDLGDVNISPKTLNDLSTIITFT